MHLLITYNRVAFYDNLRISASHVSLLHAISALMLSSLLPRSSVYSSIDRRRNGDEEQQESGESQQYLPDHLDPFEQEQEPEQEPGPSSGRRQSYSSSSHASTSSRVYATDVQGEDGNARPQPGDEREDDMFHSMQPQTNPFDTRQSQLDEDDPIGQQSYRTDLEATFHKDQGNTYAAGPPTSLYIASLSYVYPVRLTGYLTQHV